MTPCFLDKLDTEQIDAENWKIIDHQFRYQPAAFPLITVPMDFVTDYASTPRFVWIWMPKSGEYNGAAVVHDFLYKMGGRLPDNPHVFTKAEADSIFYEALGAISSLLTGVKVGAAKRWLMYQGVRIGGKGSF